MKIHKPRLPFKILFFLIFFIVFASGCKHSKNEVVVYNTVDNVFSEPILQDFEKKTGIKVRAVFDTEETKSTGILNRIIAESDHPQCDVFWSGDPIRAQVLKRRNLLAIYKSPAIEDIDKQFLDPDGQWTGFSARARVLIYNKNLMQQELAPHSVFDLTKIQYKGKVAIGNPLFGTTSFHIAAIFSVLGDEAGKLFMENLKANGIVIAAGNGDVKKMVLNGEIPCGLTDTDDAFGALESGAPIGIIYLDQDSLGTLIMPNTLSLIKNSPNQENGKKLIDFLLSRETEARLAVSCAQMPLHSAVKTPDCLPSVQSIKAMNIDYSTAAIKLEEIQLFLKKWIEN